MSEPNRILLVVLAIAIVMAVAETLIPALAREPSSVDLIASLIFAVCAFAWVKADARARQVDAPPGSALLAALIIPIGLPIYFFRALGFRRGLIRSLKAFGFILIAVAAYVVASLIAAALGPVAE